MVYKRRKRIRLVGRIKIRLFKKYISQNQHMKWCLLTGFEPGHQRRKEIYHTLFSWVHYISECKSPTANQIHCKNNGWPGSGCVGFVDFTCYQLLLGYVISKSVFLLLLLYVSIIIYLIWGLIVYIWVGKRLFGNWTLLWCIFTLQQKTRSVSINTFQRDSFFPG